MCILACMHACALMDYVNFWHNIVQQRRLREKRREKEIDVDSRNRLMMKEMINWMSMYIVEEEREKNLFVRKKEISQIVTWTFRWSYWHPFLSLSLSLDVSWDTMIIIFIIVCRHLTFSFRFFFNQNSQITSKYKRCLFPRQIDYHCRSFVLMFNYWPPPWIKRKEKQFFFFLMNLLNRS